MGKTFGNLQRLYGVTYYTVSPYEVKPFAGMLKPGFTRTLRRFRESFFFAAYPFVMFYLVRNWANEQNEFIYRKHAEDYKDEE